MIYVYYKCTILQYTISLTLCTKVSSSTPCVGSVDTDKAGIAPLIPHTHVNDYQSGRILSTYTRLIEETNLHQCTICVKNCSVPTVHDVTWPCCIAGECGVGP